MNIVPVIQSYPDRLLNISPRDILSVFDRPTILEIPGKAETVLFLSVLLHGNETTSFRVMQRLLTRFKTEQPNHTVLFFVGNVEAAAEGKRRLSGKVDFNRIWKKGERHPIAESVIGHAKERKLIASLDIHNNTGANPLYACINSLRKDFYALARRFAEHVVYFIYPDSVHSMAFQEFCPALTLECGVSEDPEGIDAAEKLILEILDNPPEMDFEGEVDETKVFHTMARVVVDKDAKIGSSENDFDSDLLLIEELESLNFSSVQPGTLIGKQRDSKLVLTVESEHGEDITDEFLDLQNGEIRLKKTVVPSMFTRKANIIHMDCLGYLMESIEIDSATK